MLFTLLCAEGGYPRPPDFKLGGPESFLVTKMYTAVFNEEIIQKLVTIPGHLLLKSGDLDINSGVQWPLGI